MTDEARRSRLDAIPDWGRGDDAAAWLAGTLASVGALGPGDTAMDCSDIRDLDLREAAGSMGWYAAASWRRFALAIFAADLACYEAAGDQVSFDRLCYVVSRFPQGFRLWWRGTADGGWLPVGYTGWYPVSAATFSRLEAGDPALADRLVPPEPRGPGRPLIYLFNYSAAPSSRGSALSSALMRRFADDVAALNPAGLAAITVSEDGVRIAARFGMALRGRLDLGERAEWIYAVRRES